MPRPLVLHAPITLIAGCSASGIMGNTTDAAVFVTTTAVRGVIGAGQLAVRGAVYGARQLQEDTGQFPAGTIVCLDAQGEPDAAAVITGNETVCPAPL